MATQFLWSSGSGGAGPPNTGLTVTAVTLMSTDITSSAGTQGTTLLSSYTAISAISLGTSIAGVFASSDFGQAQWADIFITFGTSGGTAAAGANIAGWWLTTPDFTTFESTNGSSATPLARSPDWIVPLLSFSSAIFAGSIFKSQSTVQIPALPFKLFIQNNSGVTLFTSATAYPTIKIAPYAMQY